MGAFIDSARFTTRTLFIKTKKYIRRVFPSACGEVTEVGVAAPHATTARTVRAATRSMGRSDLTHDLAMLGGCVNQKRQTINRLGTFLAPSLPRSLTPSLPRSLPSSFSRSLAPSLSAFCFRRFCHTCAAWGTRAGKQTKSVQSPCFATTQHQRQRHHPKPTRVARVVVCANRCRPEAVLYGCSSATLVQGAGKEQTTLLCLASCHLSILSLVVCHAGKATRQTPTAPSFHLAICPASPFDGGRPGSVRFSARHKGPCAGPRSMA